MHTINNKKSTRSSNKVIFLVIIRMENDYLGERWEEY